jgi:hypothetical protein
MMNLGHTICLSVIAALGFALLPGSTVAQQKPFKDQLIGTWTSVAQYSVTKDGTRREMFGAKPVGRLIFDSNDRFSYALFNPARPKFASGTKEIGTLEEYTAMVQGAQAYFGTYSVNEANSTVTYHIEGSLLPNWQGTDRFASSVSLVGDELKYSATTPGNGTIAYQVWKRSK